MVPKDQPFPKYARDYFDQLRQQFELVLEETGQQPKPAVAKLFAKEAETPDSIAWADVFALESAYLYALADSGDIDRVRAELLQARARYREIADAAEYATYSQTVEADISKITTIGPLRAELLTLAERMRYLYTFVPPKEAVRNKMAIDAAWWTLAAVVFALAVYGVVEWGFHVAMVTILVVGFVGQMGGFLSVQQRLQTSGGGDPLFKELQLSNGWFSVVVIAPLSGAVFAIVLYFVFVGGLMTGGLFPRFGPAPIPTAAASAAPVPAPSPPPAPVPVTQFLIRSEPTGLDDWGKLLVWAFVAGFAERFVPDVLTRLTGQTSLKASGSGTPVPIGRNTPAPAGPPDGEDPNLVRDKNAATKKDPETERR